MIQVGILGSTDLTKSTTVFEWLITVYLQSALRTSASSVLLPSCNSNFLSGDIPSVRRTYRVAFVPSIPVPSAILPQSKTSCNLTLHDQYPYYHHRFPSFLILAP